MVTENQRVTEAVTALSDGDLARFGELMNASHDSLRDDYEVSCRELDVPVSLARETEEVLGARMTGAGFGGCTVNLIHEDAAAAFSDRLEKGYAANFESKPGVFVLTGNLEAGPVWVGQQASADRFLRAPKNVTRVSPCLRRQCKLLPTNCQVKATGDR